MPSFTIFAASYSQSGAGPDSLAIWPLQVDVQDAPTATEAVYQALNNGPGLDAVEYRSILEADGEPYLTSVAVSDSDVTLVKATEVDGEWHTEVAPLFPQLTPEVNA